VGDASPTKTKSLPRSAAQGNRRDSTTVMKKSARYAKIVEWSEEDQCYVGSSPGLVYGGCHSNDEKAVFDELCQVVEEAIALYHKDCKPLSPPTSGRDYANKMQNVA
jgi:hypothetical protein